jgi:hypothetical protein
MVANAVSKAAASMEEEAIVERMVAFLSSWESQKEPTFWGEHHLISGIRASLWKIKNPFKINKIQEVTHNFSGNWVICPTQLGFLTQGPDSLCMGHRRHVKKSI